MEKDIVTKDDERPAGKGSGHCFYCLGKIGTKHRDDCVILQKTVTVAFTITMPWETARSWNDYDTEFHLNDSSWCADNLIRHLEEYGDKHGCICAITEARVVKGSL